MPLNHEFNQEANDWVTCRCGKLFANTKRSSARKKFFKHITKMNNIETEYICDTCKEKLKGLKGVEEHTIKNKHYVYTRKGVKGQLCTVQS
jgi:DNA-directed RNA polymerase subunit RPC12/RpoP